MTDLTVWTLSSSVSVSDDPGEPGRETLPPREEHLDDPGLLRPWLITWQEEINDLKILSHKLASDPGSNPWRSKLAFCFGLKGEEVHLMPLHCVVHNDLMD